MHGESTSPVVAGIVGIQTNIAPASTGAGVYGESRGGGAGIVGFNLVKPDPGPSGPGSPGGPGGFFKSEQKEGIIAETKSLTKGRSVGGGLGARKVRLNFLFTLVIPREGGNMSGIQHYHFCIHCQMTRACMVSYCVQSGFVITCEGHWHAFHRDHEREKEKARLALAGGSQTSTSAAQVRAA